MSRFFVWRGHSLAALLLLFASPCFMSAPTAPPLTEQQQSIVVIAACTAQGNLPLLREALALGLDRGLTISEEKEILAQLYAYCGFPRSLNGLTTLMQLVEARNAQGKHDRAGREASPATSSVTKYTRGKQTLEQLTGKPEAQPSGVNAFCPEIDVFLKEHLFADIFERDVLTYQQRELATNAALVALGGVESQLQGHLGIALHIGLTETQLRQLLDVVASSIGQPVAEAGRTALTKALAANNK